jgi:hypothetical protein
MKDPWFAGSDSFQIVTVLLPRNSAPKQMVSSCSDRSPLRKCCALVIIELLLYLWLLANPRDFMVRRNLHFRHRMGGKPEQ